MATKSEKSAFSILGCTHKFGLALERAGGEPADLNRVAEDKALMRGFIALARGRAKITIAGRTIKLNAVPHIPAGWSIALPKEQVQTRAIGLFNFDQVEVALYLDPGQQGAESIKGTKLRKALEGQLVLPANVLDYYLVHPELIPEKWKRWPVFFWGTIYHDANGRLCVRYLNWDGVEWYAGSAWLGEEWDSEGPAAVLASQ